MKTTLSLFALSAALISIALLYSPSEPEWTPYDQCVEACMTDTECEFCDAVFGGG